MQLQSLNIPQEILIPNSQIFQGELLGKGGFGQVFVARWNREVVAIKRLALEKLNDQAQEEFEQEITLHRKLNHPRVIRLYGIIAEPGQPYGMVMAYAEKGSLFNLLEKVKQSDLSWDKRKEIAIDIIGGMQYLHDNGIIHRDLKSLNVLLDKDCRALLADFGLSKVRSQTSSQSAAQLKGTIQFLAPELLCFNPNYTAKTDIYAYGIMLWELATHRIPYGNTNPDVILSLVKQGQREEFPDEANTPKDYQELTESCWAQKPNSRPAVETIQILLDKMNFGKSNLQTAEPVYSGSIRNNSYALNSDMPLQISNGYALNTESFNSNSSQNYVLESQNSSPQSDYILKTQRPLPNPKNSSKPIPQPTDIKATYTLALQYFNQALYAKAVPLFEEAAKQGHSDAQHKLGLCYKNGQGIAQDWIQGLKYFRLAADQGHLEAQTSLAFCYKNGLGVPRDYTQAVKYFLLGANQGDATSQFWLGICYKNGHGVTQDNIQAIKYFDMVPDLLGTDLHRWIGLCFYNGQGVSQDYAQAVKYFLLGENQGDTHSQFWLGICYKNGYGVKKDIALAVKYFLLGDAEKNPDAQYNLGLCYETGQGVAKNIIKAVDSYRSAADQGHADAQYQFGLCRYNGQGNGSNYRNYGDAVKYFQLAADQGHAKAQKALGNCYKKGKGVKKDKEQEKYYFQLAANQTITKSALPHSNSSQSKLLEQDGIDPTYISALQLIDQSQYLKALPLLKELADKGHVAAQFRLGFCYYNGQGLTKDCDLAAKYYRLAADKGHSDAQHGLGVCYANGHGIKHDDVLAVKYFLLSADQGNVDAQIQLGNCYQKDTLGLKKDDITSMKYLRLAVDQDDPNAQYELGELLRRLSSPRDYTHSIKYFRLAADQGHLVAQCRLAHCYKTGDGVTQNNSLAFKYYRLAAYNGHPNVQYLLGVFYKTGREVTQDYVQATIYFHFAADERGNDDAQYELGVCYEKGQGVTKNLKEAKKYYSLAAVAGNKDAKVALKMMNKKKT